jgi:ubiquitin-protein ligase
LVNYLDGFIGDLEKLTAGLQVSERQQRFVEYEIEIITDIPTLEHMVEARSATVDTVSDAASRKLESIKYAASLTDGLGVGASQQAESSLNETFYTAPLRQLEALPTLHEAAHDAEDDPMHISAEELAELYQIQALVRKAQSDPSGSPVLNESDLSTLRSLLETLCIPSEQSEFLLQEPDLLKSLESIETLKSLRLQNLATQNQRVISSMTGSALLLDTSMAIDFAHARAFGRRLEPIRNLSAQGPTEHALRSKREVESKTKRIRLEIQRAASWGDAWIEIVPWGDTGNDLVAYIEGPPQTPYEGGIFALSLSLSDRYPLAPPACRILTKIYHPNIDSRGEICLNVLTSEGWSTALHIQAVLVSIAALLSSPNYEDPLVPEIAQIFMKDPKQFDENARLYTRKYATLENALALHPFTESV